MTSLHPGGFSNYFLTECAARGLPPLPISKDFVFTKKWMIFFKIFANRDPFLRGLFIYFLP